MFYVKEADFLSYGPPILLETLFMLEATLANSPIADSKRIEAELVRILVHTYLGKVCLFYIHTYRQGPII